MPRPTLDDLHREHGTQPAPYLDDYLAEHKAHLVPCRRCGRRTVIARCPTIGRLPQERCGGPEERGDMRTKQQCLLRGTTGGEKIAICHHCRGDGKVATGRGYPSGRAAMNYEQCRHCGGLGYHPLIGRMRRV